MMYMKKTRTVFNLDSKLVTASNVNLIVCSCAPAPPPPTQYYLGYAYACSLPLKAPPYLRTDNMSEPPFRGLFAGFSCLGDPPKSKTLLNVPPIIFYFLFYNPLFKFLRRPKRERKKNHPFLKEISGWNVKYPPFFFTILGPDFVARKIPLYRRFWEHACGPSDPGVGGGGGGRELRLIRKTT